MPSKLTFHISNFDTRVFDLLQQMQPTVVKIFEFPSDTNVDEIRRRCPGALIVYRQYTNLSFKNPADLFVAELTDTLNKLRGRGIVWEGINEPVLNSEAEARAVSDWYVRFASLMHVRGEKVAAYSFSTGNPRLEWVPLLAPGAAACDYLALHEYAHPVYGIKDLGRYRLFRNRLPASARKPVLITECGLDDGANHGWQTYLEASAYLQLLADYDRQIVQDRCLVGATIFQYGAGSTWQTFDVAPIGVPIAQYVAGQGGGGNAPQPPAFPAHIYGVHDLGGRDTLVTAQKTGWLVDTVNLQTETGKDYSTYRNAGIEPIVRLNNGYDPVGTIPVSSEYATFATKCAAYVRNSPSARVWIIGNEMNIIAERPTTSGGVREIITPAKYVDCFVQCRDAIRAIPGHADDWVVPGAIAPSTNDTAYSGNTRGDWVQYLVDLLNLLGDQVDALALHAYTHAHAVAEITSDSPMSAPFTDRQFHFRAYRDFLNAIPARHRLLPVLITETDPLDGWQNINVGWAQGVYQEVNAWSAVVTNQPIQALALFRWNKLLDRPEYGIEDKPGVLDDLRAALARDYRARWANTSIPVITQVAFAPTSAVVGDVMQISVTITNASDATLATQGPDPGFVYDEGDTFITRGFGDVGGAYRIGVDFDGHAGIDHSYRWGLGSPLAPGETRTITGGIRFKTMQARNYWVGLVHERIAWLQDRIGTQLITVNLPIQVTSVTFSPTTIEAGQTLSVSITVRNNGTVELPTQGPDPGFLYEEGDSFYSRGFPDTMGSLRVGVDFDGRIGVDHPYRWGFGSPLQPGETRTITGAIRLRTVRVANYWAGLVQERVAWIQDRQGTQAITVNTPSAQPPRITNVTFTPTTLSVGQSVTVSITVRNDSSATLDTQGPDPGFMYREGDTFDSRGYAAVAGKYRVGVDLDGRAGLDHPYRWGFGTSLAPGETRAITGTIQLTTARAVNYWAGLVNEYVAWVQDRQGTQTITVNSGLRITSVAFAPTTLAVGELLNVSITVRNDGAASLDTQAPDPGFVYNEGDTFDSRGHAAVAGKYRVGIDFDGRVGLDHPYRWGFGTALQPGETRTITGAIRLTTAQARDYWAGLVHEYVAWMQDREGTQRITVSDELPAHSFTATPSTIAAGQSATLAWNVASARTVTLDGAPVAVQGTQVVAPTQTTTYVLRIVFLDGRTRDLSATVTVAALPPGATRYPSVTIMPANVARLQTFPRPTNDNGRGLHFHLDLRQPSVDATVQHLTYIGCKWTLIYAQDELQAGRAAQGCWNAGIMPVVRIGKKVDENFDPVPYVNALKNIGAPAYIQIYNEPGDPAEWRTFPGDPQWIGIFAGRWSAKAAQVVDAGGYPGLQVYGRDEFDAVVNAVAAIGRTDIWERAFYALHNYGANHPADYPYDALNQSTIFDDDVSVLSFIEYAAWMLERIGFVLPIIGGEGGWKFGVRDDTRYPPVDAAHHAQYHAAMFDWFRAGVIANGEPLPDYLFSATPWIAGGWGNDDWWGGPLGDKTATHDAIRALPAFTRKFTWDGVYPPLPPPHYSFTATPATIQRGASSTLTWDTFGARMVFLDGARMPLNFSQVVSPTQTTTYVLRLILADGTTQELRATVTVVG
ncbi:MAG: hypothetical protein HY868_14635 [Chloroflexi bacterium]|nr:hypothetical protein [Chloroflexota bacterium]